jgi:lysozyme
MAVTFAIDVSHHQSRSLNLAQTRRDGCELAILKAGEGNTLVDSDFASNLAEARAAGQLVAAYWYQRSAATAAQHVAKIKEVVPLGVPVILDVEANSGSVALTRDLVGQIRAAGYRVPLLYLPRWYWQQIGSPSLAGLPPLWSSRYPNNTVGLLASEWAEVPASYWRGYGGLDVALLQFTSSAKIAGYAPLDASAFRGTRTQLAALLNPTDWTDMATKEELEAAVETGVFNALKRFVQSNEVRWGGNSEGPGSNWADCVLQTRNSVVGLQEQGDVTNDKLDDLIEAVKANGPASQ